MYLLSVITILNSLTAFAHEISKPIKSFLLRPSSEEKHIKAQIAELKQTLDEISVREEFNLFVKTERKINLLEKQLSDLHLKNSTRTTIINCGTGYAFQAMSTFLLFIISFWFRNTPVLIFDGNFNFSPFNSIIGFPTGIDNAISVPFWIFVSNFSLRSIAGSIRSIKC